MLRQRAAQAALHRIQAGGELLIGRHSVALTHDDAHAAVVELGAPRAANHLQDDGSGVLLVLALVIQPGAFHDDHPGRQVDAQGQGGGGAQSTQGAAAEQSLHPLAVTPSQARAVEAHPRTQAGAQCRRVAGGGCLRQGVCGLGGGDVGVNRPAASASPSRHRLHQLPARLLRALAGAAEDEDGELALAVALHERVEGILEVALEQELVGCRVVAVHKHLQRGGPVLVPKGAGNAARPAQPCGQIADVGDGGAHADAAQAAERRGGQLG